MSQTTEKTEQKKSDKPKKAAAKSATKAIDNTSSSDNTRKIAVRQIRSAIGRTKRTRQTLIALGLGRIGAEKILARNSAVMGMIGAVGHLVTFSEVN